MAEPQRSAVEQIDGDEEEEVTEEEEEEEDEPRLKYQRLGHTVSEILKKDAASCLAAHEKFLALGTHWGAVCILDHAGTEVKRFTSHTTTVNDLDIDANGEYVASCSDDGKVVVHHLYSNETAEYEYNGPIGSVALEPTYPKSDKRELVCGGKTEKLVLNTKGWFGRKNVVLHAGEGPIHAVKWRGSLIAWANNLGVKVYDCNTEERIAYIDRTKDAPRPDMYRCSLAWENDTDLVIGWGNFVKIGRVSPKPGTNTKHVQIIYSFQTDFFISGIAPFRDELVLLAYTPADEKEQNKPGAKAILGNLPELRIVSRQVRDSPQLLSSDALSIHEYERCKATDYRLAYIQSENIFYIVSPKDIVVARPPDLDDHISWLIGVERYEQALAEARGRERELRTHKISDIGQKFLDHLLENDLVDQAAEQCANLLGNDVTLWEHWVYKFEEKNSLRAIANYVPTRSPQLSSKLYEIILSAFVDEDAVGFLSLIEKWPPTVYKLSHIVTKVSFALEKERDVQRQKDLTLALSKLFIFDRQYDKALDLYLRLGLDAFDLINQHGLEHFPSIGQRVLSFMRLNPEKATQLFSANLRWIPVEHVIKQLASEPRLQLKYLHQLFIDKKGDDIKQFYDLQITLYAEHDVDNLAEFLEKSNTLSITNLDKALELCSTKKLWSEMVWILGKMGNTQEALELMVDKVGDVKQAIEFVQKQDDPELWDELIKRSIMNPVFVSGLLENVGTHINPLTLIDKIPRGMEIIGLRDRLVKIIYDYNLQTTLKEGCTEVLKADCKFLADKLIAGLRKGMKVEPQARCPTCNNLVGDPKQRSACVVFFCGHTYHQKCLNANAAAQQQQQQQQPSPSARKLNASAGGATSPTAALAKTAEMAVDKGLFCSICRQTSTQDKRPTKRP